LSVIVALDDIDLSLARNVTEDVCDLVKGFKIGLPFILRNGLSSVKAIRNLCRDVLWIADLKLADIGYVMSRTVQMLAGSFDAVIAHSFVGIEGALDELTDVCRKLDIKLILVSTMSHPGATEIYDFVLFKIRDLTNRVGPWGLVAPATRKDIIRFLRLILDIDKKILAPGVGPQGALPGDALCAGADYEIIGRLITRSKTPRRETEEILNLQREALKRCKG